MLHITAERAESSDQLYRDANGLIMICMYCHRTRRNLSDQWDWVEAYASGMAARASHGICKACLVAALEGEIHIRQTSAGTVSASLVAQNKNRNLRKSCFMKRPPMADKSTPDTQSARRNPRSTKVAIQSLAHQLWLNKRTSINPAELEWLVDGRLTDQLDVLSRAQLARVRRLLEWTVGTRQKTAGVA